MRVDLPILTSKTRGTGECAHKRGRIYQHIVYGICCNITYSVWCNITKRFQILISMSIQYAVNVPPFLRVYCVQSLMEYFLQPHI